MIILAVDSSAVTAGCAVYRNGERLAGCLEKSGLTHSQTLLPLIDRVMKEAGVEIAQVDRIAVSAGPGSFTGIRIGTSTVKGMAFTYDIPCVEVSTLDVIACSAIGLKGCIAAVMDARRGQVYNALYTADGTSAVRLTEDRAIAVSELAKELENIEGDIWLCGDGAVMCFNMLREQNPRVRLAPEDKVYQSGEGAALAAIAAGEAAVVPHGMLRPRYLRLPQAERELNNKRLSNS